MLWLASKRKKKEEKKARQSEDPAARARENRWEYFVVCASCITCFECLSHLMVSMSSAASATCPSHTTPNVQTFEIRNLQNNFSFLLLLLLPLFCVFYCWTHKSSSTTLQPSSVVFSLSDVPHTQTKTIFPLLCFLFFSQPKFFSPRLNAFFTDRRFVFFWIFSSLPLCVLFL